MMKFMLPAFVLPGITVVSLPCTADICWQQSNAYKNKFHHFSENKALKYFF